MSDDTDNAGGDYPVGYQKPPRNTRFRKGQSGNPKGRPRKAKPIAYSAPALRPTATALAKEARRMITVREGDKREEVNATEAVIRSMFHSAVKGGVFAQRTYMELQFAEDERQFREKQENFSFWRKYVADARVTIETARSRGRPDPALIPHPDDIVFDFATLEITCLGPTDDEEAAATNRTAQVRDHVFELIVFFGEECSSPTGKFEDMRAGFLGLHLLQLISSLPPRLRSLPVEAVARVEQRSRLPMRSWRSLLEQQSEELGLPMLNFPRRPPVWSLAEYAEGLDPHYAKVFHDFCNRNDR